jgi:hypothetical protein
MTPLIGLSMSPETSAAKPKPNRAKAHFGVTEAQRLKVLELHNDNWSPISISDTTRIGYDQVRSIIRSEKARIQNATS